MQGKNLLDIGLSAEIPDIETRGLTSSMAEQRLARYGKNILASEKKAVPLKIFLGQFRDIMVMILLAAAGVSAFLGETADAVTIVIIVAVNALLGFIQEYRTEKTLAALRGMTAPTAKVWRDGHMIGLPAAELVPDDVISLEAGDKVPADGVILRAENLLADESILTGESSAVVAFRLRQLKLESDDKKVQMEFILNDKKNHRWIYDYPRGCQKGCRYDTLYSLVDSVSTVEFKLGGKTCVNIYERRFKGDADSNVVLPELMPVISHNQIPLVESLGCDLKRLVMSKKGALLQLEYKDGSYIRKQDYIEADSSVKAD